MKLVQQWRAFVGPTDERIVAETNRIYRVGFIMLSCGILAYLYYDTALKQAVLMRDVMSNGAGGMNFTSADLFLQGWVFLTMIVCVALQWRKGFTDDNRFAEVDTFPINYYALVSCFVSVGLGVLTSALRVLAEFQVLGADGIMWSSAMIQGVAIAVVGFLLIMFVSWVGFKTVQSRRMQWEMHLDE